MRIVLRGLRVLAGVVAAWQCIGLLPVFTWLSRPGEVTVGMAGAVLFKLVILAVCVAAFYWLGVMKRKRGVQPERIGDVALTGITLAGAIAVVIGVALLVPSNRGADKSAFAAAMPATVTAASPSIVHPIIGEWQCTDGSSKEASRLILHPDGSVSANVGSGPLLHDPWLHWYAPVQGNSGDQVMLLRLRPQGESRLVVQSPNGRFQNCTR